MLAGAVRKPSFEIRRQRAGGCGHTHVRRSATRVNRHSCLNLFQPRLPHAPLHTGSILSTIAGHAFRCAALLSRGRPDSDERPRRGQIKSRELKARARAVAQAAAAAAAGGDGNRPITLCPADDWQKGVAGRRLGPLQVLHGRSHSGRAVDSIVIFGVFLGLSGQCPRAQPASCKASADHLPLHRPRSLLFFSLPSRREKDPRSTVTRQNPSLSISTVATVMHLKQFLISKLRSDVSVSAPPLHSFPVCCRRSLSAVLRQGPGGISRLSADTGSTARRQRRGRPSCGKTGPQPLRHIGPGRPVALRP